MSHAPAAGPPDLAREDDAEVDADVRAAGARIDALVDALASAPPPGTAGPPGDRARQQAEELVRVVSDLYGAGLERLLTIVHDSGRLDEELLGLLARDELVAGLLLVHGLHPYDVPTRVEQALADVRPYLGSHGGDVELVEVTAAGTVRLRLLGSCDGCPSSSVTLELAVRDAVEAAAPEVATIEVEAPTGTDPVAGRVSGLIPVESLRTRLATADGGGTGGSSAERHPLPEAGALASGQATVGVVGEVAVHACRVGAEVFVFRDRCGRCGHTLTGAQPARRLGGSAGDAVLTCPGCGAHFDVRRAGACLDEPGLHLDPLPVLVDAGTVTVLLPAAAEVAGR